MSSFNPRFAETPPEPMPALRWGKSFWHVWDAVVATGVGDEMRRLVRFQFWPSKKVDYEDEDVALMLTTLDAL